MINFMRQQPDMADSSLADDFLNSHDDSEEPSPQSDKKPHQPINFYPVQSYAIAGAKSANSRTEDSNQISVVETNEAI